MLSETLEKALNDQINAELHSAYIYYAMSAYFEGIALRGLAHWMRVQALEEMGHAHKFYNYIYDRGGRARMKAIEAVPVEYDSPMAVLQATLKHEQYISDRINKLVDLALKENDHATYTFLQWYVDEQVEEEAHAQEMLDKLQLIGGDQLEGRPKGGGFYMFDREAGKREFHPVAGLSF